MSVVKRQGSKQQQVVPIFLYYSVCSFLFDIYGPNDVRSYCGLYPIQMNKTCLIKLGLTK